MAGIVFFFEDNDIDVYSGRSIDLDAWHLASLIPGDIDKMIVVNKTDQELTTPNSDIDFSVVDELPELDNAVYLTVDSGVELWGLSHAWVEWYVFGPASGWGKSMSDPVYIPQNGTGYCHSQHVMTAVMFDRYRALG